MNKIKKLREQLGLSQSRLAEMLETTQQTIGRWENGKAEPSIKSLRDLALIFGTSVDELLGDSLFSETIVSTHITHIFRNEPDVDGFWGNLGILLRDMEKSIWFPITASEVQRLRNCLSSDRGWLVASTLNNRLLIINMLNISKLWFVNDDADAPADDWDLSPEEYNGYPLEVYRGLYDYFYDDNWAENTSKGFRETIEEIISENQYGPDEVAIKLHYTTVYQTNAAPFSFYADASHLNSIFDAAEDGAPSEVIHIDAVDREFECFFASKNISLIDMPLLELMEEAKSALES